LFEFFSNCSTKISVGQFRTPPYQSLVLLQLALHYSSGALSLSWLLCVQSNFFLYIMKRAKL
jgi:hypothetical protein